MYQYVIIDLHVLIALKVVSQFSIITCAVNVGCWFKISIVCQINM